MAWPAMYRSNDPAEFAKWLRRLCKGIAEAEMELLEGEADLLDAAEVASLRADPDAPDAPWPADRLRWRVRGCESGTVYELDADLKTGWFTWSQNGGSSG